jgi:hypothetical protein
MKYDKIKVKASLMRLAGEIFAIIAIIDGTAGEGDQNRQEDSRQAAVKTKERSKQNQPKTE